MHARSVRSRFASVLAAALTISCLGSSGAAFAGEREVVPRDPALEKAMVAAADNMEIKPDKPVPGVVAAYGTYPIRPGVILVTSDPYKYKDKLPIPTGHAAIIWTKNTVIEALGEGVSRRRNNWSSTKSQAYGVTVRGTTVAQDNAASNWANRQVGKPYLWPSEGNGTGYFQVHRRDMFYCSHLVWAAFKDLDGINLDTAHFGRAIYPMELVWSDRTTLVYRKR